MKHIISKFIKFLLTRRIIRFYRMSYMALLKHNNIPNVKCPGEDEYTDEVIDYCVKNAYS